MLILKAVNTLRNILDYIPIIGTISSIKKDPIMPLILASNSPRRRDLLKQAGLEFSICPADVDESAWPNENPRDHVLRLAQAKAMTVAEKHLKDSNVLVLGADTIVVLNSEILGKPKDANDATQMLQKLSGQVHEVMTGWALVHPPATLVHQELEVSRVFFRDLSLNEITLYVQSGEPLDKAGAYAIQGAAAPFVKKLEGLLSNVIGLPVEKLVKFLPVSK